nr:UDP-glycosyltransferase 83A1-like [Tanacetum cinerariifolium]
MELSQRLVNQGVKTTFINTEVNHKVVIKNWLQKDGYEKLMHMVSIPDGLEPWEDRNDHGKLIKSILQTMPSKLEELIKTINKDDKNKVTCVIVDGSMGWAIRVAKKMGIRVASFWSASAATLATIMSFQKLIDDGIINDNGTPRNNEMIQLSKSMPPIKPKNLVWACVGDLVTTESLFKFTTELVEASRLTKWFICNSATELEPAAFSLYPQLLPIGPLLASNRLANQVGHFWQEDSTCLTWLDQQPTCSVIYVAFGSYTIFDKTQFEELAIGLELSNRPFLWVVRLGMTKEATTTYPDGYMERVGSLGKIVSWAPQQKVLAHPSIACFMSHCGWNSTLEGVTNGLPFLCWPYFADQFYNETYICDTWKTGLGFKKDEAGIITRDEIKSKVEQLLTDKAFKTKALDIKEKEYEGRPEAIKEGPECKVSRSEGYYEAVHDCWKDPIPDVKTTFSVISREESHRGSTSVAGNKHHASAFVSRMDKCYKIVGYPDHIKKKWANQKATNTYSSNNASIEVPTSTSTTLPYSSTSLSAEQVQQLLSLLNRFKNSNNVHAHMGEANNDQGSGDESPHIDGTESSSDNTSLDSEATHNVDDTNALSDNISLYSDSGATQDDLVVTSPINNDIVDHNSTSEGNGFNIQNNNKEIYHWVCHLYEKLPYLVEKQKKSVFFRTSAEAEYRAPASATCENKPTLVKVSLPQKKLQFETMAKYHVIVVANPTQGYVILAMELAQRLVEQGIKATFINTEAIHQKVMKSTWLEKNGRSSLLQMVLILDGLEPWEDRNDWGKLAKSMLQSMPIKFEELIETINKKDNNKCTCIIADPFVGWAENGN